MVLIYSLIIATVLSLVFTSSIKKHYWIYYSVATLIASSTTIYEIFRLTSNAKLYGFVSTLEKASIKGIISVSFFVLVMIAGSLNTKWTITRKLLRIRAELAIIASILLLPHGVIYLVRFILKVMAGNVSAAYLSYIIVGFIGFIIMIPLFITSLKKVRIKMKGGKWKKLQRWAYLFYALTYLHILIILLSKGEVDWLRVSTYTILFGGYAILRFIKYRSSK